MKIIIAIFTTTCLLFSCKKEMYINTPGMLVPKTVDQNTTIPSITINGAKLHSETFGHPDSAIIIVLHGGPGSDYRSLLRCKDFSNQGYKVVFYDQRGSGLSQRFSKESYSIQIMLDELTGVINHYKTIANQKVFLLGHSWGAILATAYINKYPTRINGAVLAEPGGLIWQDILDYIKRSRDINITKELFNDLFYMDQFITGKLNEHEILDYKFGLLTTADGAKDNPTGNEGPLPMWRNGAIINKSMFEIGEKEKPNWTTNLHQFKAKVLFVYSENNKAYGFEYAKKVSAPFSNTQLFKTLGGGHDMLSFSTGWNNTYPVMLNYFNSIK
ncbi:alpha/beta hydrolase [Sediminibacterium sp.]|uniref:alpha/beta hydrolase n=1 Tax=Sediminibacterium sp. TaxID=1917865 RepID=UPI003F70B2EF